MNPKLGEPGSAYVDHGVSSTPREEWTQDGQLIRHRHTTSGFVFGPRKLITANLHNLSQYLTDHGAKVKAWSFFSGELPGAEMLYQAKQEPEDVVDLAGAPLFDETLDVRARDFLRLGLGSMSIPTRLIDNGMQTVYLVDDCPAFEAEMLNRGELSKPYWKDPVWDRLKQLQVRTFFGVACDSSWGGYLQRPFRHLELDDFEGYRAS